MPYTHRPSAFRRLLDQPKDQLSGFWYSPAALVAWRFDGAITEVLGWPFPEFMGYLAKGSHFAGPILVAIGLLTKPALIALVTTLTVAALVYHRGHPFHSIDTSAGYLVLCLVILHIGPGKNSLDYFLTGRR